MTCQDIAERIGITKNYYWLIERGDRNLSYPLAVKIANVFGLEPDDIFLTKKVNITHTSYYKTNSVSCTCKTIQRGVRK
ncbi:XRE family transcriptional regulator [Listeria fleischmannii FSL S10-1203]|uniref:XRE family transcriptional regulator n=2 Tax=Listeria fleischmannii TaxID=1069827 RepID=W7DEC8_9LIST|nr:XRE family transcriptional regulator [Listeria fleischmannii FSL S10-1203]